MMNQEFQVISVNSVQSSTSIACGICSKPLDGLTLSEREEHCEHHFVGEQPNEQYADTPGESSHKAGRQKSSELLGKVKRKWMETKEMDVFWYPSQATSPPSNYTPGWRTISCDLALNNAHIVYPGIIPLLKNHLWTCHAEGITCRAALCYKGSVHVNRELWDASWGCGYVCRVRSCAILNDGEFRYRNFSMVCAALMDQTSQPLYFPLLDAPIGPGVRNLQTWIESAWQAGTYSSSTICEVKHS
jgi:hypothetical protein